MPRISPIRSAQEYFDRYADSDAQERALVEGLFGRYPKLAYHPSFVLMAHDPRLTERMLALTDHMSENVPWNQRSVRKLAILLCDKRLKSEDSFMAHYVLALRAGLTEEQLTSLDFPESDVFDDEQQLVLRFTASALDGCVPDDLFEEARVVYGDRELVELAVALAFWTFFPTFATVLKADASARPSTQALWAKGGDQAA